VVHVVLFGVTFLSTVVAGAFLAGGDPLRNPAEAARGLAFAIPLLSILGIHELGHYLAARRHRVAVTAPYFLPAPSLIGTFGAFIRIRSPIPHRDALLDIGAAGPLCGALAAVPILAAGLALSTVRPAGSLAGIPLGESLLFKGLARLVLGEIPRGHDVVLHPVAFAGWIGLLVTALNLLPSGQLDGGHIAYALFGPGYARVAGAVPWALLPLGLLWKGWFLWAGLLLVLGTRHPAPVFDQIPVSPGRRRVGIATAVLFVLCFTPNPVPL